MAYFLQLSDIILDRLKSQLSNVDTFVSAPSFEAFIEFSAPTTSICVIYSGYETNDNSSSTQSRGRFVIQNIQQTWQVVLKVRHFNDLRQFDNARLRASQFIDKILNALDGWKPHSENSDYNHMILRLIDGKTEPVQKHGDLYYPFFFKSIYNIERT